MQEWSLMFDMKGHWLRFWAFGALALYFSDSRVCACSIDFDCTNGYVYFTLITEQREYMIKYLKIQGNKWKMGQLKKLKPDELEEEFDKCVEKVEKFIPMN
ncbi:hypothetical protein Tco_0440569, partial [Tanacetum coccineum]